MSRRGWPPGHTADKALHQQKEEGGAGEADQQGEEQSLADTNWLLDVSTPMKFQRPDRTTARCGFRECV
jgi:hypothetical protein